MFGVTIVMQHDIPFHTVVSSLKRLLRYSLGSVALGSLIVSIVEWVRFILESLRRRLKFVDSARGSRFGKTVSSSSQCCLGCIDWTLKSVNRNAYVMVGINILHFLRNSVI
jgi:solute carrier family 44 (choline transporter-like protein), member 2/4/5